MSSSTTLETQSRSEPARADQRGLSLAVADVGWFNTENLFREIDRESVAVLLLKCLDYVNGWRRGVYPWSQACRLRPSGPRSWEQQLVLPSGWMKRYPGLGMRPVARAIRGWWQTQPVCQRHGLVMTYPHYLYLSNLLRPDVSIYYNIDDYSLYWPCFADQIRKLERRTVLAADVTVCVSRLRADELQACTGSGGTDSPRPSWGSLAVPGEDPLSRPAEAPPDLARLPRPYLGYIGSLEDRVDWELMESLSAELFPTPRSWSSVVCETLPVNPRWKACSRFLSRPNVHTLGWRPQEALPRFYQAFDVCLIPYRIDHPFNRACNPTKIMDAMGSGRPIVATAISECRLHAERFHVVENQSEFLRAVGWILACRSDDGRAALWHAFALANTCHEIGERILDLLEVGDASRRDPAGLAASTPRI